MKVLLASNNAHKLAEIRGILSPLEIEVVSPSELSIMLDIAEDGDTFEANAIVKAEAFRARSGLTVLADDSGLEVDALGGQPGVRSARYAGLGATDADRVAKLLHALADAPTGRRGARFVCVVAIAIQGESTVATRGECAGSICEQPRGANGFGYDPVFVPDGLASTMAQLEPDTKNRISHRGRAFRAACALLARPRPQ